MKSLFNLSIMTSILKKLTGIENRIKHIITGYSREHENLFSISFPMMIQYLFMLYYWIDEHFTIYGDKLLLKGRNRLSAESIFFWHDITILQYHKFQRYISLWI